MQHARPIDRCFVGVQRFEFSVERSSWIVHDLIVIARVLSAVFPSDLATIAHRPFRRRLIRADDLTSFFVDTE